MGAAMTAALVVAVVLELQAPRPPRPLRAAIARAATAHQVDRRLLAALVDHESSFRPDARSARGEVGLGQLLRGTLATRGYDSLTDDQLAEPGLNLWLAARHLARVRRRCGGSPERWVSAYSGRRCGPSGYSRAIVAAAEASP